MNLVIEGVGKPYNGKVWGLRDLSLTMELGVLGLLGPNGAGKSTLMSILATITKSTSGTVTWNGADIANKPNELRAVLGYLPQDFGVYPNLTAVEFLSYIAALKGLAGKTARRCVAELIELVNLIEAQDRPVGGFSGGMRQRLGNAQPLLNDPQLLIVDEQTAGLDPQERVRFRNLLADLAGERIVILSTHIVSDVEAVATDIALISNGRLIYHDSPEVLLAAATGKVWRWVIPSRELPKIKAEYIGASMLQGAHVAFPTRQLDFGIGYTVVEGPIDTFYWSGVPWTAEIVAGRLIWLCVAFTDGHDGQRRGPDIASGRRMDMLARLAGGVAVCTHVGDGGWRVERWPQVIRGVVRGLVVHRSIKWTGGTGFYGHARCSVG